MKNKIKLTESLCCTNCKHYTWKDLKIFRYMVESKCKNGHFKRIYYGDGDYAEDETDKQVCSEYTSTKEEVGL